MEMADLVMQRCRALAECTEEPGFITRTFLSAPMREVHARVRGWMEEAGMRVSVDNAGNIRGCYEAREQGVPPRAARRLYIGSHLDTVPRAGAFDGILGVVLGIALVDSLHGRRLGFHIEVIGFSEEEGVRFGVPFIGSRALIGDLGDDLLPIHDAIRAFGLDPSRLASARADDAAIGFLEFHIEQGPVLEDLGYPVALVDAIAGQSRLTAVFHGQANHAGTTPMRLRRDALAGAAEWVVAVERAATKTPGMVATVGRLEVDAAASNVIPGQARVSLDARHAIDQVRHEAVESTLASARDIAERRGLAISIEPQLDQSSVAMDPDLTALLEAALLTTGSPIHRMTSGAGHDAMIMARRMPAAMLFLRSPGGISHHPDESVLPEDVASALRTGYRFLEAVEALHG